MLFYAGDSLEAHNQWYWAQLKLGIPSRSPTWVAGPPSLEPSPLPLRVCVRSQYQAWKPSSWWQTLGILS